MSLSLLYFPLSARSHFVDPPGSIRRTRALNAHVHSFPSSKFSSKQRDKFTRWIIRIPYVIIFANSNSISSPRAPNISVRRKYTTPVRRKFCGITYTARRNAHTRLYRNRNDGELIRLIKRPPLPPPVFDSQTATLTP